MSTQTYIVDDGDLRKYRIELPNLVDDLDLSPFAFRLYAHFKRVCGASPAGHCWQGTRELAAACRMSTGKISDAKKELEAAGLIEIGVRATPTGPGDDVKIVDIWRRNFEAFSGGGTPSVHHMNASEESVQDMNTGGPSVHHMNDSVHHMNERINQLRIQPASQPRARANTASQDAPHTAAPEGANVPVIEESSQAADLPPAAAPVETVSVESVSLETIPHTPSNEPALASSVWDVWCSVEPRPRPVRTAQLRQLVADHGAYWVGRAILHAADCDDALEENPKQALNYVGSILTGWRQRGTYGSDHPDYQRKQQHAKEQHDERDTATTSRQRDTQSLPDRGRPDSQGRTAPTDPQAKLEQFIAEAEQSPRDAPAWLRNLVHPSAPTG